MFTGLVQAMGKVVELRQQGERLSLIVESSLFSSPDLAIGDSVSNAGVCLTIVKLSEGRAAFELATETVRCTTLAALKPGNSLNLERSLKLGDQLGGHFVFGHVDAVVTVSEVERQGATWRFAFTYPDSLRGSIVEKGSVAIDGVSLTVGEVLANNFRVYIVPHTYQHTTFQELQVGARVNLEVDMLARYVKSLVGNAVDQAVERLLQQRITGDEPEAGAQRPQRA